MARYKCYACNAEIERSHLFVASNGKRYPVCRSHKAMPNDELDKLIKNNNPHLWRND